MAPRPAAPARPSSCRPGPVRLVWPRRPDSGRTDATTRAGRKKGGTSRVRTSSWCS